MTDEQRLQVITDQLILVRDNLFRGMSKSIQKLQARSINEVLELENFTRSPQRQWTGMTDADVYQLANEHLHYQTEGYEVSGVYNLARAIESLVRADEREACAKLADQLAWADNKGVASAIRARGNK